MIFEFKQGLNDPDRIIYLFLYSFSQDYRELPKRSNRANGNIYHIFKANSFRDVENLDHNKTNTDLSLNEYNT